MDRLEEITYPPLDILHPIIGKADYEYILLWMLSKNNICTWANFTEKLSGSTIHGYLSKLLDKGYIQKLEKGVYQITQQGEERFSELIYDKSLGKRKLNYPPKAIMKKRNYDHWILWMLYNNPSCKWSDFKQDPLSINQSSLSSTINSLLDKGFINKENKHYKITSNGKIEYLKVLKSYDLDRQSILEQESKRIEEITEKTSEFFNKYDIKQDKLKFRYINYILKLNYSKVESILKDEESFNKILLFLTLNHPNHYPNYISPKEFSLKYKIDIKILEYYLYEFVEKDFFQIKIFKIDDEESTYYFQKNTPFEKMLNVIVEKYVTQFTYLNKFQNNVTLNIELLLEKILEEICGNLFNMGLKSSLKRFLPEYIKDLAYKIDTDKNIKNQERNLEDFVLQNIFEEFETFVPSSDSFTPGEIEHESYSVDKQIFDVLELFYMSKLNFLKIDDIQDIYNLSTINKFDQIWNVLYKNDTSKARKIYEEIKDNIDYFHKLILQDIIFTSEDNFKESIKTTQEVIKKFPEDFIGYLFQSITYLLMDDYENSKKIIENGIKKAPHYLLLCQKAQIFIKNRRGMEILDNIDKEISKHPKKIALLRIKSMIYITQWDNLVMNYHEYPSIVIDSAIKLDPNDAELLLLKSIFYILINKNREAKRLLINKINLNLFKRNQQIDTATFFILIFSYVARGKFQKAMEIVNKLNEFYPNHPISFLSKAFVLGYNLIYKFNSEEVNLDLFLQLINKAISYEKLKYNKIKILVLQAAVLFGIKQFEQVIETINKGIELAPDLFYIYYIKIFYLIIANRTNEILNLIDNLVEKFPDFKYLLYDRKVLALFKAKKFEEALELLNILMDYNPKSIAYHNNKVFILTYLGRKDEAIATAEKLIQLNPNIGNSYDTYGEIYLIFGEYENALEKFEESLRIEPLSDFTFVTIIRMAYCYMKMNNYEKAKEYFKKGKDLIDRMIPSKKKFFLEEVKCAIEELKSMTENK